MKQSRQKHQSHLLGVCQHEGTREPAARRAARRPRWPRLAPQHEAAPCGPAARVSGAQARRRGGSHEPPHVPPSSSRLDEGLADAHVPAKPSRALPPRAASHGTFFQNPLTPPLGGTAFSQNKSFAWKNNFQGQTTAMPTLSSPAPPLPKGGAQVPQAPHQDPSAGGELHSTGRERGVMRQTRHRKPTAVPAAAHSPPAPALLCVPGELPPMVPGSLEPRPQGGFWTTSSASTYKARNRLSPASPAPAPCREMPGARCPQPLRTEPHGPAAEPQPSHSSAACLRPWAPVKQVSVFVTTADTLPQRGTAKQPFLGCHRRPRPAPETSPSQLVGRRGALPQELAPAPPRSPAPNIQEQWQHHSENVPFPINLRDSEESQLAARPSKANIDSSRHQTPIQTEEATNSPGSSCPS